MKIRQIEYKNRFFITQLWKIRCSLNPKAQALNKAQQQLRPELYFPEFLNRGSVHLTDSTKKSENREEVIANNNTGLVKPVKIQNNKKLFANLCCGKNITEYRAENFRM